METEPILEFQNVTKLNGSSPEDIALDNISCKIYPSEITTFIKLGDREKSSIIQLIAGLQSADKGEIVYNGIPISQMSQTEKDLFRTKISCIFQQNEFLDSMTVFDNIAFPLVHAAKLSSNLIKQKVIKLADELKLTELLDLYPSQLSEGTQKRVALARAIVTEPEILIVDEPTAGQDFICKNEVLQAIARHTKKHGLAAVLISREIPDALLISDRVLVLYGTQVVFQGTPEELGGFHHPFKDEMVQSLENLGEELNGTYARLHFRIRYQSELAWHSDSSYALLLFSFDNMVDLGEAVSHDLAQEVMNSLGAYIHQKFRGMGGFSTRISIIEYATILPFSDLNEAKRILKSFAQGFREKGMAEVSCLYDRKARKQVCVDLSLSVGVAQGNPPIELEAIIEIARYGTRPIAEFE